jgi:arginyl-tRNA synthetase
VSGRKGLGVKADDLIDKLVETVRREVDSRHEEAPEAERRKAAEAIAIGALRYFMLKYTRNAVIAFDFQEALSFEGETGPYVQYTAVRARNILRKNTEALPDFEAVLTRGVLGEVLKDEELWQMALSLGRTGSAIEKALEAGEPAHMARYAFQLAQAFNNFYHKYPVLAEVDAVKRAFLLWLTQAFYRQLDGALGILGIDAPEFM